MKRAFLLLSLSALLSLTAAAQNLQLAGYIGHQTPSSLDVYYGRLRTSYGTNYGGTVTFGRGPSAAGKSWVEVQYNYKEAGLNYYDYKTNSLYTAGNLTIHNVLVGPMKEVDKDRIRPYGGLMLGVTVYKPDFAVEDWRFTVSVVAGVKISIIDRLGLRLQAQLLAPMYFTDAAAAWSPGYGNSVAISSTAIVSAGFNAGIYFNILQDN
jgi:hypothetical protein